MKRSVKSTQRLPRVIGFKVTGTGTAAITQGAPDATLVDNGTGDWTLTFAAPFARAPIVVANSMTALGYCEVKAASATAFNILGKKTADNTALDVVFHAIVLGYDSADEI